MFWFIVFLLMLGAVFYMYQNLRTIEKEILEEQQKEKEESCQNKDPEPKPVTLHAVDAVKSHIDSDNQPEADNELIALIKANPGIKQTELYARISEGNTKQVQQMLKKMSDGGEIRREKEGSSYRLYV
jgi:predicted DNA repair protein MutK